MSDLVTLDEQRWLQFVRNFSTYPFKNDSVFYHECEVNADVLDVFDFCARPQNMCEISPPSVALEIVSGNRTQLVERGSSVSFRSKIFSVGLTWQAYYPLVWQHKNLAGNSAGFVDIQVGGLFERYCHVHRFEKTNHGKTRVTDYLRWKLRGAEFASKAWLPVVHSQMAHIIGFRQDCLEQKFQKS